VTGEYVLIRPLKMLIIPLILFSVVSGVCSIGDPSRLGLVGGATVFYYLATMAIAVTIGATLVTMIQPGDLDAETAASLTGQAEVQYQGSNAAGRIEDANEGDKDSLGGAWKNILDQLVPTSVFGEMSKGNNPLSVIVVSLLLGIALAMGGDKAKPARDFFTSMFDTLMRIVGWIIMLTPIGVFFLMAWTVGSIGLINLTGPLALYVGTVLSGLLVHALIVLPVILFIFGRTNPFQYLVQVRRALMTAFATDSSSATMPVTLTETVESGGCSKKASNFVIPLGATVNMDGTALYEAVATVFLFQVFGIDLSMGDLVIVVITATLAAVGAAGIPGAGLVTMVIVIGAVNTSLAGRGIEPLPLYAIGIILGIDRIVDMCRTTVNVWGDAVGAKIMTRIAPDEVAA
jgi:Na+/H+-dicarboxylate symporter